MVFLNQPAQLFCQASSQFNLFLGVDFAQMGCNQNAGSSHGPINSEEPDGYSDVNLEQVLFWYLSFSLC